MDSVIHIKNRPLENEPFLILPTEDQDSKRKASDCIILQRQLSILGSRLILVTHFFEN